MTRYVALYCRLSPRPDGSYEGVDAQKRWGTAYAKKMWPGLPVEVFADKGISAANGDHRPEFERLRQWVTDGRITQLWCVEQSRLTRSETEWFVLAAELDAAGITEMHTNRDGVVRVGDEISGIKAVLAASEVRKLKRRVNDKFAELAAEGRPGPGGAGFGYRRVGEKGQKTYEVIPENASIIREVAEKILTGWGLITIARELDARGVRGSYGGKLSPRGVKHWVTSPSVAGLRVYQGRVVGNAIWEPILDEDTWQAVCAKLSQPRRIKRTDGQPDVEMTEKYFGRSTARRYLITGGIAVCAVCRAPLSGGTHSVGKQRVPYLTCHRSLGGRGCIGIKLEPVQEHVINELFAELDKPAFLEEVASDDHVRRREEIGAALDALQGRRNELAEAWATGADGMTVAEWQTARRALTEQEQRLRDELAAVPRPMLPTDISAVQEAWPDMTLEEQREFLSLFVDHIAVAKGWRGKKGVDLSRITIEWKHL